MTDYSQFSLNTSLLKTQINDATGLSSLQQATDTQDQTKIGDILNGLSGNQGTQQQPTPAAPKAKTSANEKVVVNNNTLHSSLAQALAGDTQQKPLNLDGKIDITPLNITAEQIALPKDLANMNFETNTSEQNRTQDGKAQQNGKSTLGTLIKTGLVALGLWQLGSWIFGGGSHKNQGNNKEVASNQFGRSSVMIAQVQDSIDETQRQLRNVHLSRNERAHLEKVLMAKQDKYDKLVNGLSHYV